MKKASLVAKIAAIGCASVVAVGCFGYGLAAAGGSSSPFGGTASSAPAAEVLVSNVSDTSVGSVLSQPASRDITQGVQAVEAEKEAERIAAEQAALAEEQARIQAAEQALAKARTTDASSAMSQLAEVDWSCGKDAFISEWANRINNYLAGSRLPAKGRLSLPLHGKTASILAGRRLFPIPSPPRVQTASCRTTRGAGALPVGARGKKPSTPMSQALRRGMAIPSATRTPRSTVRRTTTTGSAIRFGKCRKSNVRLKAGCESGLFFSACAMLST